MHRKLSRAIVRGFIDGFCWRANQWPVCWRVSFEKCVGACRGSGTPSLWILRGRRILVNRGNLERTRIARSEATDRRRVRDNTHTRTWQRTYVKLHGELFTRAILQTIRVSDTRLLAHRSTNNNNDTVYRPSGNSINVDDENWKI